MGKVVLFPVPAGAEFCPPPTEAAAEVAVLIAVKREVLTLAVTRANGNLQDPAVLLISQELDVLILAAYR